MQSLDDGAAGLIYSAEDVLLLFGDREEELTEARAAAQRAGCRIAGEAPIAAGAERLDAQMRCDAVLIQASRPSGALDALLNRLSIRARRGAMSGVVIAPPEMIDLIAAADLAPSVEHLCEPTADEIEQALADTLRPSSSRVHDRASNPLKQLSEDAARIAAMLAALSGEEAIVADGAGDETDAVDAAFVRAIIRARRLRDQYLRGELFADPAFDMLLDLYAARLEDVRVAVSSLCIAAAVPATTALRWIKALTEKGLFVRTADPEDGRRVYISLTDDVARAMGRYLSAVQKGGLPTV